MKTRIVYLCFAAILVSYIFCDYLKHLNNLLKVAAIASITVGSLGYVWLDEIGEVLRDDSFAYSFSITLITIGVASFFFCIVFFREPSLRWVNI